MDFDEVFKDLEEIEQWESLNGIQPVGRIKNKEEKIVAN